MSLTCQAFRRILRGEEFWRRRLGTELPQFCKEYDLDTLGVFKPFDPTAPPNRADFSQYCLSPQGYLASMQAIVLVRHNAPRFEEDNSYGKVLAVVISILIAGALIFYTPFLLTAIFLCLAAANPRGFHFTMAALPLLVFGLIVTALLTVFTVSPIFVIYFLLALGAVLPPLIVGDIAAQRASSPPPLLPLPPIHAATIPALVVIPLAVLIYCRRPIRRIFRRCFCRLGAHPPPASSPCLCTCCCPCRGQATARHALLRRMAEEGSWTGGEQTEAPASGSLTLHLCAAVCVVAQPRPSDVIPCRLTASHPLPLSNRPHFSRPRSLTHPPAQLAPTMLSTHRPSLAHTFPMHLLAPHVLAVCLEVSVALVTARVPWSLALIPLYCVFLGFALYNLLPPCRAYMRAALLGCLLAFELVLALRLDGHLGGPGGWGLVWIPMFMAVGLALVAILLWTGRLCRYGTSSKAMLRRRWVMRLLDHILNECEIVHSIRTGRLRVGPRDRPRHRVVSNPFDMLEELPSPAPPRLEADGSGSDEIDAQISADAILAIQLAAQEEAAAAGARLVDSSLGDVGLVMSSSPTPPGGAPATSAATPPPQPQPPTSATYPRPRFRPGVDVTTPHAARAQSYVARQPQPQPQAQGRGPAESFTAFRGPSGAAEPTAVPPTAGAGAAESWQEMRTFPPPPPPSRASDEAAPMLAAADRRQDAATGFPADPPRTGTATMTWTGAPPPLDDEALGRSLANPPRALGWLVGWPEDHPPSSLPLPPEGAVDV
ncbi:hypothetical protein PAPYR_7999 [Paratrimastix pyriformis]|uniref:Uncharacterized protein n=1 Tax=Paratrimastix pyriformis TaxID=342808 RepID=A0ABQ8UH90_9EUKA|nr:hypothetical protein PAPYR_7999 [Paratrimastix pyriformis]